MVTRKDPLEYWRRLRFHLRRGMPAPMASEDIIVSLPPDPDKVVEIWTDGGCKPNPALAAGRRSCASAAWRRNCPAPRR